VANREFSVAGSYQYDRSTARRWIVSHLWRHRRFAASFILPAIITNVLASSIQIVTGSAFNAVLGGSAGQGRIVQIALTVLALVLSIGVFDLIRGLSSEVLGKRFSRDARDELYLSLLGKSQTFHNRQRVGDIMARATNDVGLLSDMVVPAMDIIVDSSLGLVIPIIFIGFVQWQLLLTPLLFTAAFIVALRAYTRRLHPVAASMRQQFGIMNTALAETVSGIDVVKATGQEEQEQRKFTEQAGRYRDFYVQNGRIQARYVPPLLLAVAMAGLFLHGLIRISQHQLTVGGLISCIGLMGALRYPVYLSIWTFNLVQLGIAAAHRILALIREETELDEQQAGYSAPVSGEIVFERVSFRYGDAPVLRDVSFRVAPGQTVAIVGQTGSGKSTLTKLVNRIYDVDAGRVLIDGVDVRDWQLASLRSQISTIEQDIFLFSRSIAENIGFGLGQNAERPAVEQAARDAQAHEFIMGFKDGYETLVGERGITLSGGQRQRIAIARALLTDPRILIMDDATSAIDSATEDEIQQAMRRLLHGRTTLLITHRLSQIRHADSILVLRQGSLIDQGTHEELLGRCDLYRRIFAHTGPTVAAATAGA
jgi:ATP-binding cassette subfamily B protein